MSIYMYLSLALSGAGLLIGTVCLIIIIRVGKDYVSKFKDTGSSMRSLTNKVEQMRQSPPRIRTPYEERLKAEYEKRGMKWETTGK